MGKGSRTMYASVIIPVYNVEPYLGQCLDSILKQIPADTQLILVDDGSTDDSGKILDRYAQEHPQMTVIHKQNGGVASARNAALCVARGDYLLWADPDDWVQDGWYARIAAVVDAQSPDIVHFDYAEIGRGVNRNRSYGRPAGPIDTQTYLRDVSRDLRVNSALWCRAMKRSLFDGVVFDETLSCLEDYDVLHTLILRAKRIVYLPQVLYAYRLRADGLVRTLNLDVSYKSYLVACKRAQALKSAGKAFGNLGVILQARGFCRNFYYAHEPAAYRAQYLECRAVILKGLLSLLGDKEVSLGMRLKTIALVVPPLGRALMKCLRK